MTIYGCLVLTGVIEALSGVFGVVVGIWENSPNGRGAVILFPGVSL